MSVFKTVVATLFPLASINLFEHIAQKVLDVFTLVPSSPLKFVNGGGKTLETPLSILQ